jgi:hypothetical protein
MFTLNAMRKIRARIELSLFLGGLQRFQVAQRYDELKKYMDWYKECKTSLVQLGAGTSLRSTVILRLACPWLHNGRSALACTLERLQYDENAVKRLIDVGFPTPQDKEHTICQASSTGQELLKSAAELCNQAEEELEEASNIWHKLIHKLNNRNDSEKVVRPTHRS